MKHRLTKYGDIASVVAAAFLLAALVGCEALDVLTKAPKPSAHVAGARLQDINVTSATMVFDVDVKNPYSVPLPLVNLDYRLASRGAQFLDGEAGLQGSVPAGGTKRLSLPARLTYKNLLTALKDVRPGSVVPYDAEFGLSVDTPAGALRVPMAKSGNLPVPTAPDIRSLDVSWDKLALDQAVGVFKIELANRNQFPVDLSKIAYSLFAGDTEIAKSSIERPVSFAADGGVGAVEIPVTLIPKNLGIAAWRMLRGGGGYKLKGAAEVSTPFGPMSLPVGK